MTKHKANPLELHILGIKQEHDKPEQHAAILCKYPYVISQYGMKKSNWYAVMSPSKVAQSHCTLA
jgi:hypothetical protein